MGLIGNAINSIKEGVSSLGQSVSHAVQGEWEEAGKDFARFGLEGAGIAGTVFLGPGAEVGQEAIEGALDNAVLERRTGDVPGPGGGSDWSPDNLLEGAIDGAKDGAMGVFGGMPGGGDTLGKVLGAAGGSGGGGGPLKSILGGMFGGSGSNSSNLGGLLQNLTDLSGGMQKMNQMQGSSELAKLFVKTSSL